MARDPSPLRTIGRLSAETGVKVPTIRFYEHEGLLPPPGRRGNGYRVYDRTTLNRLAFIRSAQSAGLTLAEIRKYGSKREAKLHTRAGMGPCQGRVCGPALKHLMGWKEDTIRPPIFPASVHALLAVDQSAAP